MFTGIVQSLGIIKDIVKDTNSYIINTDLDLHDCKVGSSINCDGICLTAISISKHQNIYEFEVNVGEETFKRTNLIHWKKNYKINLEKSLRLGDEIAGHFVYGHVDITIPVKTIKKITNSWEFEFSTSELHSQTNLKKMIVEKGSIAINGISLTVANVYENSFIVSVIPHTFENTNFSLLAKTNKVNIEFDPLARYISKYHDN